MQLLHDRNVPIEAVPYDGPVDRLVRCKAKLSPKCQLWHLESKKCCNACAKAQKPKKTSLTERQLVVLKLYTEGMSIKEIANTLNISPKTVEFHFANVRTILGIQIPAHLVQYALHHGIIQNRFAT